ncbi:ATP-grasp ribosomal peptide maturase [Streptomyces sp. P38-E01]|uniref:ATP-grasp ribosomal peptide maturase n=1 Tax=Streptomyces tardus TaxID=2780544 RepID=A0A949JFK3_9ACTN|nr:ATP-grasp ribosomal peptide maturase [Streptomyces tardus]MBU7598542.1 ATP-grasp ribosomal peptide maturase [Streptomyces tardus]
MTSGRPVIVVSRLDDATCDLVVEELNRRHVPVVRLDPGDFPEEVAVSVVVGGWGLDGELRTPSRSTDPTRARSVYWRRPSPYTAPAGVTGQDARWCREQARYGLGGILCSLPGAYYLNHPWQNQQAEHKPAQLATAVRCDFDVPPTLMTNVLSTARKFAEEHGPVVYKPLRNTEYRDTDRGALTVWVDEVKAADLDAGVAQTMHLFQKQVPTVAHLRVTAVGGEIFSVRIDGSPGLDWRRHYEELSYTLVSTPPRLAHRIERYLKVFGLTFGAFDFGIDRDGRTWWFECNPNGQYAWFPEPITRRIVRAVADRLQHAGEPYAP